MTAVRRLVIAGAGGFARETAERRSRAQPRPIPPATSSGTSTTTRRWPDRFVPACPSSAPSSGSTITPTSAVTVCIGSPAAPAARRRVVARLGLDPSRFATLVHPRADLGTTVEVGAGSVIHAGCVITADVRLGRHVEMMPGTVSDA